MRAKHADSRRPGVKILLMSGVDALEEEGTVRESLSKSTLTARMRKALDWAEGRVARRFPAEMANRRRSLSD